MSALSALPTRSGVVQTLHVGTRGSALARVQAQRVIDALAAVRPDLHCEIVVISTEGDRDKQTPLSLIGGQGIFVKELQRSLLEGKIDCAVHSVKDLPATLPAGSVLAAVLDRADPRDALISCFAGGLSDLPPGARVGASGPRRKAQLKVARRDVEMVELRGNVDTRVAKVLDDSSNGYDAAILAVAGLERMGWGERIAERLDIETFTPAPGQGALGVECRADDQLIAALLASVADPIATDEINVERAFLAAIGGGCRSPLAATARVERDRIRVWAMLSNEDMTRVAFAQDEADLEDGPALAAELAEHLKRQVAR